MIAKVRKNFQTAKHIGTFFWADADIALQHSLTPTEFEEQTHNPRRKKIRSGIATRNTVYNKGVKTNFAPQQQPSISFSKGYEIQPCGEAFAKTNKHLYINTLHQILC